MQQSKSDAMPNKIAHMLPPRWQDWEDMEYANICPILMIVSWDLT